MDHRGSLAILGLGVNYDVAGRSVGTDDRLGGIGEQIGEDLQKADPLYLERAQRGKSRTVSMAAL
jgi:hypothetical protein